jgi:hypothetical protein
MATPRKTFTANPPRTKGPVAPQPPADTKRTFDMRPKPTDYPRHEDPRYRAPTHPDTTFDDPTDDSKE